MANQQGALSLSGINLKNQQQSDSETDSIQQQQQKGNNYQQWGQTGSGMIFNQPQSGGVPNSIMGLLLLLGENEPPTEPEVSAFYQVLRSVIHCEVQSDDIDLQQTVFVPDNPVETEEEKKYINAINSIPIVSIPYSFHPTLSTPRTKTNLVLQRHQK
ncbi:MAG: hypothetical protein EZS28_009610, partial [Streblomastix strix]